MKVQNRAGSQRSRLRRKQQAVSILGSAPYQYSMMEQTEASEVGRLESPATNILCCGASSASDEGASGEAESGKPELINYINDKKYKFKAQ